MSRKPKKRTPPATTPPPEYEVGYGKPPVHSRYQPGQSGNPGGRKRGQRNLKSIVRDILEAEIELGENGRKRLVVEALVLRLVQAALKDGDIRAITRALELYERFADTAEDREGETPCEHDLGIIRRAIHGSDPEPEGCHDDDLSEEAKDGPANDDEADEFGGGS